MMFFGRFLLVPLATLGLIGLIELLSRYHWFTPSLALPFAALALGNYWGGFRSGLAAAAIITGYALYGEPFDTSRAIQIGLAAFSIALAIGYLKRKARLSEAINGNLLRLAEALRIARGLKLQWADLSDANRYKQVELLEDRLGNMAALVQGWLTISQEIRWVQRYFARREWARGIVKRFRH